MADELEKILGEEEKTAPPVEPKVEEPKVQEQTEEEKAKQQLEQDLIDLGKAKTEAMAELSRLRKDKQALKKGTEEEELPDIDAAVKADPNARAWDKRIKQTVEPVQAELEKAREEVRSFALQQFLKGKPSLSKSPEKVKELMGIYDRLHTASERTVEGVLMDLNRSYGAMTYQERESEDYQNRIEQAENDARFADPGISRGATGEQTTKPKKKQYTEEERDIVKQWEKSGAPKL